MYKKSFFAPTSELSPDNIILLFGKTFKELSLSEIFSAMMNEQKNKNINRKVQIMFSIMNVLRTKSIVFIGRHQRKPPLPDRVSRPSFRGRYRYL